MNTAQFSARVLASLAGLACAAVASGAGPIEVIYAKYAASPKSDVPGWTDAAGNPISTKFRALEELAVSPDGSHWGLKVRTQAGDTLDTGVVAGSGTTGTTILQESRPVPGAPDFLVTFIATLGNFNASDVWVFTARSAQGSTERQRALRWDGTNLTLLFSEFDPYTNLIDQPTGNSGDEQVGNSVAVHILDDGTIGAQDPNPKNLSSFRYDALTYNRDRHFQNGDTVTSFGGIGTDIVTDVSTFFPFQTTPDGDHWMVSAALYPILTREDVIIRDGVIVLQENRQIPGSSVTSFSFSSGQLATNGDWYVRGEQTSTSSGPDYIVRNGAVLAVTGDAIATGNTETWTGLNAAWGNGNGDYIVRGKTSADEAANDVVVLNGTTVVLREGDPVDLDGDGQFDDDAFIGRGNNTLTAIDRAVLTDNRWLYAIVNLRNAAGQDLASNPVFTSPSAFVRIDLNEGGNPCPDVDFNQDGGLDVADIAAFFDAFTGNDPNPLLDPDVNQDGGIDVADIDAFFTAFAGGPC